MATYNDPLMKYPELDIGEAIDDIGQDAIAEQLGYQRRQPGLAEEVEQEYDYGREDGDPKEVDLEPSM